MPNLTLGSHLTTPRIGYQHHGLYIGNEQVIHFTSNGKVEIVSLSKFTDGNGYNTQPFRSKFNRHEIVERAKSRLGKQSYNLMFNNCEHFCNWCIQNKRHSNQIRNVTLGSAATGLVMQATRFSTTQIIPPAVIGFGVFKLVQFLSD